MNDIKIALIDSGLDYHISIPENSVIGGHSYYLKNGKINRSFDFSDTNGHGTALAGMINYETNYSKFYIIRILNENNKSNGRLMIQAIRDALELDMDIIHLSLGTENMKYSAELEKLVDQALNKNILIVSAKPEKKERCIPADLEGVFKVLFGFIKNKKNIYWYNNEFYAQGVPQMVPYKKELYRLMKGSSISASHLTAKIAKILSKDGKGKTFEEMNNILKEECWQLKNKNISKKDIWNYGREKHLTTKNSELYKEIRYCTKKVLGNRFDENIPLWFQGVKNKSYPLLSTIEEHLKIQIDYLDYNFFHFFTLNDLVEKINQEVNIFHL